MSETQKEEKLPEGKKFWIELGPVLIFLLIWRFFDIYWATGALMILTLASVSYLWVQDKKMPVMPLFSLGMILLFGGMTLYLKDPKFVKMKPTIFYVFSASLLFIGLFFNKIFLQKLMGQAITLSTEKWKKFTINFGLFFIALAIGNEILRRMEPEWLWGAYKIAAALLTMVFVVAQIMILKPEEFQQQS